MRLALVPRPTEFYDLFTEAGANALLAAQKAETRFREFPSSSVTQGDVKSLEHEGDRITRDVIQLLNTQYVTPFDREDIYELATKLDDVVDYIEEVSELLELYGIESTTRHAVDRRGDARPGDVAGPDLATAEREERQSSAVPRRRPFAPRLPERHVRDRDHPHPGVAVGRGVGAQLLEVAGEPLHARLLTQFPHGRPVQALLVETLGEPAVTPHDPADPALERR